MTAQGTGDTGRPRKSPTSSERRRSHSVAPRNRRLDGASRDALVGRVAVASSASDLTPAFAPLESLQLPGARRLCDGSMRPAWSALTFQELGEELLLGVEV